MARSSTRSTEVDRAARRAANSADKVKSPPKHEKNVLLHSLVKHIESEKIRKASDCGVIASVMKERQAQYPWLKRGMLYHLMTTLDGVIKDISLHMGSYPIGRHAATFKKSFNQQKAKPHLEWLDDTFMYVLFRARAGNNNSTPSPNTIKSPPPIRRVGVTPTNSATGVASSSDETLPSTEGRSSRATLGSSNEAERSLSSQDTRVAAQVQQPLNLGGGAKERFNRNSNHRKATRLD
jgi:hypothetical protein